MNGMYMVSTDGVHTKRVGDTAYAKDADATVYVAAVYCSYCKEYFKG